MRSIAYLIKSGDILKETGVIKKINSQKDALERSGCRVNIYKLNIYGAMDTGNGYDTGKKGSKTRMNILGKLLRYHKSMNKVIDRIKSDAPDAIYIRDMLWFFNLHSKLSKIAPVFLEVQSNILEELKVTLRGKYIFEKVIKRSYLKDISGFICITGEIYKKEFNFNNKPGFILGNGIDEGETGFALKRGNDSLINLVFIGSPGMEWHGLDRLITSFVKSKIKSKFILHIAGLSNDYNINDDNIIFYGFISDTKLLDEIVSIADIGIGTLGLYKKDMNEAAPLKVRYYLGKGLPVIIGYDDVDLDEGLPFILKVPNDDSDIDFIAVEEFHNRMKQFRESGYISNFAFSNLTWDKKMQGVLRFMESTIG